MTKKELEKTIKDHLKWIRSEDGGKRADLRGADLSDADLRDADLRGADLSGADLRGAYLSGSYLSGAYLSDADLRGSYLSGSYLSGAYLSDADLRGAYLRGADLSGAYLSDADLRGAYLSGADLSDADLRGADLSDVKGVLKELTTPLYMLHDQKGKIIAYKLVNDKAEGPQYGGLKYEIGKTVEEKEFCSDETVQCGAGINLATLDWCLKEWRRGYKILCCEFTANDIVAIPIGSDGKFRVKKCKVVGEKDLSGFNLDV